MLHQRLDVDPYSWTGDVAPPESEVVDLVEQLRLELGPCAFLHLCAAAVFPGLHPRLTEAIGGRVTDESGAPVVSEAGLVVLAKLPWFRSGRMPDWLRIALITCMPPDTQRRVRDAWRILLDALPDDLRLSFPLHSRSAAPPEPASPKEADRPLPTYADQILLEYLKSDATPLQLAAPERVNTAIDAVEFDSMRGPFWILFAAEFLERFAFYSIRWALVLYIVAQFYGGGGEGYGPASQMYGGFIALSYLAGALGGLAADRALGYRGAVLTGALVMAAGLGLMVLPAQGAFVWGLAMVAVGNGLFKPSVTTMVGHLFGRENPYLDSGFTIFYAGINLAALLAPVATGWLANQVFGDQSMPAYRAVFVAATLAMFGSAICFWMGQRDFRLLRRPSELIESRSAPKLLGFVGVPIAVIAAYAWLSSGIQQMQSMYFLAFLGVIVTLLIAGFREGREQGQKAVSMVVLFGVHAYFWMVFEQTGSSLEFLSRELVDRSLWGFELPADWTTWAAIVPVILLAPLLARTYTRLRFVLHPSASQKFAVGLLVNGSAFFFLASISSTAKVTAAPMLAIYFVQALGELCLTPIGLAMVATLAPRRWMAFAMSGFFLSTVVGISLAGYLTPAVSGEGVPTASYAVQHFLTGSVALGLGGAFMLAMTPVMHRLMGHRGVDRKKP